MAARLGPLSLARQLTHQQKVTRLYRKSLKHLLSWAIDRELWREKAMDLRERFDVHKFETDRKKIERLLADGEAEFRHYEHPAPYIAPTSPNGSKWERNIPPPPNLLAMLPMEEQWYREMCEWADGKD